MNTSEQLLNDLVATLEKEIAEEQENINKLKFELSLKKAKLKRIKGEHPTKEKTLD